MKVLRLCAGRDRGTHRTECPRDARSIWVAGKQMYLGGFVTSEAAACALTNCKSRYSTLRPRSWRIWVSDAPPGTYDLMALKLKGPAASLNFPRATYDGIAAVLALSSQAECAHGPLGTPQLLLSRVTSTRAVFTGLLFTRARTLFTWGFRV